MYIPLPGSDFRLRPVRSYIRLASVCTSPVAYVIPERFLSLTGRMENPLQRMAGL